MFGYDEEQVKHRIEVFVCAEHGNSYWTVEELKIVPLQCRICHKRYEEPRQK